MSECRTCPHRDFLMIIDSDDLIRTVIPNDSKFEPFIGQPVTLIMDDRDVVRYRAFCEELKENHMSLNFNMALTHEGVRYPCFFNGYQDGVTYVLIVLFDRYDDQEVLKRMMTINSQQVNELRKMYKTHQNNDFEVYNKMTKLNNELLNSKRIIEKQNAELMNFNTLLRQMAIEDALTGSYNRRYFYDYMRETVLPSQQEIIRTYVMIDFNHFKAINDRLGHDAGDRLLILFVRIAKTLIGDQGIVFRHGGDEFILVLSDMGVDGTEALMKRINDEFSKQSTIASLAYGMIEVVDSKMNQDHDVSEAIRKADQLMYVHKRASKDH